MSEIGSKVKNSCRPPWRRKVVDEANASMVRSRQFRHCGASNGF